MDAYYISGSTITKITGTSVSIPEFKSGVEIGVVLINASIPDNYSAPTSIAASSVWVAASAS